MCRCGVKFVTGFLCPAVLLAACNDSRVVAAARELVSRLEMDEDDLMSVNDLGGTSRRKHNTEAENYRKPWSDEEDGRLRSLVKEHGAQLRASPYPTLALTLAPAITLTLTLNRKQVHSSGRRSRRTCPAGTASNAASGGTTSSTTA